MNNKYVNTDNNNIELKEQNHHYINVPTSDDDESVDKNEDSPNTKPLIAPITTLDDDLTNDNKNDNETNIKNDKTVIDIDDSVENKSCCSCCFASSNNKKSCCGKKKESDESSDEDDESEKRLSVIDANKCCKDEKGDCKCCPECSCCSKLSKKFSKIKKITYSAHFTIALIAVSIIPGSALAVGKKRSFIIYFNILNLY
jgi:hypothetical protein